MDETAESYAYRCLPLNIANAHGWEILCPCGFEARWMGRPEQDSVEIRVDEGAEPREVPVSLFGHGTITFHVDGIFRTPAGWNLWVGGSPNAAKDGIAPLGGVVETDWSPYTFTMNWRFTRPGQWVRFEENEPFCFFFPVPRGPLEAVTPRLVPIEDAPELAAQFEAWSVSRDAFQAQMEVERPAHAGDTWQKLYYRGVLPDGSPGAAGHQAKLRLPPFAKADGTPLETACPVRNASPPARGRTAGEAEDGGRNMVPQDGNEAAAVSAGSGKGGWFQRLFRSNRP
jgi:hypothetical protein